MPMNPLPPQAYTKETLLKAYSWLQNQPEHIRELATTPDILVSLYLKAHRDGDSSLDRPSILNFKSELKNLAGMMGEFEVQTPTIVTPPQTASAHSVSTQSSSHKTDSVQASSVISHHLPTLDPQSMRLIHEVKTLLNLSNDSEALRAAISAGHAQIRKLFH